MSLLIDNRVTLAAVLLTWVTAAVFVLLPPLPVGGLAIWFPLLPFIALAYLVPPWAAGFAVVAYVVTVSELLVWPGYGHIVHSLMFASLVVLLAVCRQWAASTGAVLFAGLWLSVVAAPLGYVGLVYGFALEPVAARLVIAWAVLTGVLSVAMVEVLRVNATLWLPRVAGFLRRRGLQPPRLAAVFDTAFGGGAVLLITVLLASTWSYWRDHVLGEAEAKVLGAYTTFLAAALADTEQRMDGASVLAGQLLRGPESSADVVVQRICAELGNIAHSYADFLAAHEVAIFSGGEVLSTPGLDASQALVMRGWLAGTTPAGMVAERELEPDTGFVAAHYIAGSAGNPDILIAHYSGAAARHFQDTYARRVLASLNVAVPYNDAFDGPPADGEASLVMSWLNDDTLPLPVGTPGSLRRGPNVGAESWVVPVAVGGAVRDAFLDRLFDVDGYRIDVDTAPVYRELADAQANQVFMAMAVLLATLLVARMAMHRLAQPLVELPEQFAHWQREARGADELVLSRAPGFVPLEEVERLSTFFRSQVVEIQKVESSLQTIVDNYDALLHALPLGVLAADGAGALRFCNGAIDRITRGDAQAIASLLAKAGNMAVAGDTMAEWELQFEPGSAASLILAVTPRFDDGGTRSGFWVLATDVTEQKLTSAQLVQAAKLATLGEMSTGMAHELNQPLNVISLASSNLRFAVNKGRATDEVILGKLERIEAAVQRAATIIDHMRAYGRLSGDGLSRVDVGAVADSTCDLLGEQLRLANIDLVNDVSPGVAHVNGNAIQLEQVLINLISNAKDAIREHRDEGHIRIWAEDVGKRVLIHVSDDGGGIPDHVLPHIFEPFFTTKPVGKGTGLGGSISYGIVRDMQGELRARNIPGGAQVTIDLPVAEASAPAQKLEGGHDESPDR